MSKKKSPVRIYLEKGALPGYTLSLNQKTRKSILTKLALEQGWGTVVKKLNVLRLFNKHKHPKTAAKFHKDMKFVQTLSPKYKSPKKQSKRRSTKRRSVKRLSRSIKKRSTKKRSTKKRSSKKLSSKRYVNNRHYKTSPSKERGRSERPSPSTGASSQKMGVVMRGNDGNMYKVIRTVSGIRRWSKI